MINQTEVQAQHIDAAILSIKAGDPDQARTLLKRAIAQDPENDRAWQWMAVVVDTAEEQRRCLYRALSINPNNDVPVATPRIR